MIGSAAVGQSSPGKPSLRNTQHHFECRVILLSVETKRRDKMVRVQLSHAFESGDEFWIILECQPAFIDGGHRCFDHNRSLRGVNRPRSAPPIWHWLVMRRTARIHILKTCGSSRE